MARSARHDRPGRGRETMSERPANDEMIQGYRDGLDPNNPEPSANRSHSYRHGFANGRDDRRGEPRGLPPLSFVDRPRWRCWWTKRDEPKAG